MTDYTCIDHAGNLLSYLYCGEGPTILLSAHMDTVEEFVLGRKIIEKDTILSSSEGILGADDRAGIAVILEVLSHIHRTNFNGTLKIAFTVKEEIGCIGSRTGRGYCGNGRLEDHCRGSNALLAPVQQEQSVINKITINC